MECTGEFRKRREGEFRVLEFVFPETKDISADFPDVRVYIGKFQEVRLFNI